MKVVQISDIHLAKDPDYRIYGLVNTQDTFIDVLNQVKAEKPDLVIVSGDISQDGSAESYSRLKEQLQTLNCEVLIIYGNHDNPTAMQNNLIGNNIKHIPYKWTTIGTFIFCDSYKENFDTGLIGASDLVNLENYLKSFSDCIIVIHHHFVKLNTFIDKYILENHAEFIALLEQYQSKIKLCITGHVHNSYDKYINGLHIHSGLSSCIQLAKTETVLFDLKRPGYTVYNFAEHEYEILDKYI